MIPHRIRISDRASGRLRYLKSRTGVTPNILSRFAFLLSAREIQNNVHSPVDLNGQEFNAPTLFGEHQEIYEILLVRYVETIKDERDPGLVIASHIENGVHKMGHVRSLEDLVALK